MTYALEGLSRIRWGFYAASALLLAALCAVSVQLPASFLNSASGGSPAVSSVPVTPKLERLASSHPGRAVEVIVQLHKGTTPAAGGSLVRSLGGRVTGEVGLINGLVARMDARPAYELATRDGVRAVTLNGKVSPQAASDDTVIDPALLKTSFNQSVRADEAWSGIGAKGKGIGVAVIDTGIAGDMPDFRRSPTDTSSRVVGSAVINPYAKSAKDYYGHGTHVAGIIAGNGTFRSSGDTLKSRYVGVAPKADLISIKIDDNDGNATVLDVIYGLQFAVDFKDTYNIRVVNLSLESSVAQSYTIDPLDAAAEAAWFNGIVVVAAAGNRGSSSDAVQYAPGNDPFVISVGGVDDMGTKALTDDQVASWSSRGTTQDGFQKPELLAPGAHIVSNLSPRSDITTLCKSCVTDKEYFRMGGTSMAAPMVAGAVADLLSAYPALSPDEVKGLLVATSRFVNGNGQEVSLSFLKNSGLPAIRPANEGIAPSSLIDPTTGNIDYTRSSWSRSRWSTATSSESASFARSSWSCDCSETSTGSIDPTRSRWSRSSWSSSWSK